MISFSEYFSNNKKQYDFNIKIACSCNEDQIEKFKNSLLKLGLAAISKPKVTPIVGMHTGFEHVKNTEISILTIVTNYPATPIQIQEMVRDSMSISDSLIMVTTPQQDEIAAPIVPQEVLGADYEKSKGSMLTDLAKIINQKTTEFEFAIDSKEKGKTSNDLPQGNTSPIGS
jgi:hypothetical protein